MRILSKSSMLLRPGPEALSAALLPLVGLLLALTGRVHAQPVDPPNVIIIFTDDQGTLDLNSYGSDDLHTPHLDALAEQGVRFTQFYAASSVCAPSRAGLLTGRYPHRAGVPSNAESHPTLFGSGAGLPAEEVTIAEMLRSSGYRTAHFGKWHLGAEPGPNAQGFEESFGFLGGVVDKYSHFNYGRDSWGTPPKWHDLYHNGEEVWEPGIHTGDLIAREAIHFMEASDDRPFFLYLALTAPHTPWLPDESYEGSSGAGLYGDFTVQVDDLVGQVLGTLDRPAVVVPV